MALKKPVLEGPKSKIKIASVETGIAYRAFYPTCPEDHVLLRLGPAGEVESARWRYEMPGMSRLISLAKKYGATWNGTAWCFSDPSAGQEMVARIRAKFPDLPIIERCDSDAQHEPLKALQFSAWMADSNLAACLVPLPLPWTCPRSVQDMLEAMDSATLYGKQAKHSSLLTVGSPAEVERLEHVLLRHGASKSISPAARWSMGSEALPACPKVVCNGWAITVQLNLSDPRQIQLLRHAGSARKSGGIRRPIANRSSDFSTGVLRTTRGKWPEMRALLAELGLSWEGDDPDADVIHELAFDPASIGGWEVPARNGHLLREYQKDGARFCYSRGGRALIADEMGIGKTAQAIAAVDACGARQTIVVCPLAATAVWKQEIEGWSATGGSIQHIRSADDEIDAGARWIVVNYDLLVPRAVAWTVHDKAEEAAIRKVFRDLKTDRKSRGYPRSVTVQDLSTATPDFADPGRKQLWEQLAARQGRLVRELSRLTGAWLIADEAHRLKNRGAKRTFAISTLAATAAGVLLLTGTPLRNAEDDAAALIGLLDAKARENLSPEMGYTMADLKEYLAYFMIRRTKAAVLTELPAKARQSIPVEDLEPDAMRQYHLSMGEAEEAYSDALSSGKSEGEARKEARGHIERARRWLGLAKVNGGAVLDLVASTVENCGCAVVFTAHHSVTGSLVDQLRAAGITSTLVDGRTPPKARDSAVRAFQDGLVDVFIGAIHAAGEAITLTRADTVIFVQLDWVPAAMQQAEDRVHRVGQSRPCQILHALARTPFKNLDDALQGTLSSKSRRIGTVLNEEAAEVLAAHTPNELTGWEDLFAIRGTASCAELSD